MPSKRNAIRAEAKALGLKTYFDGRPCPNGHIAERRVSDYKCVICVADRHHAWCQDNRDKTRRYGSNYQKNHREACNAKHARHKAAHLEEYRRRDAEAKRRRRAEVPGVREKEKAVCKAYYRKNREKRRDTDNARSLQWYYDNPLRSLETRIAWDKANPDKRAAITAAYRARLNSAPGSFTNDDVFAMLEAQGYQCNGCGADVLHDFDIDHMQPVSRGGTNWPDNLQILCPKCNQSKGAKTMEEWLAWKAKRSLQCQDQV